MKIIIIINSVLVLLLSACSPSTQIETQVIAEELIQTAISKTQTAQAIQDLPSDTKPPPSNTPEPGEPTWIQPPPTNTPVEPELPQTETPTLTNTPSNRVEQNLCEAEKWNIALTTIEESKIGDGWKMLQIEFGIENGSQYWGQIHSGWLQLITEDGFVYQTDNSLNFKKNELTQNCQIESYDCDSHRNTYYHQYPIPPGFISSGRGNNLFNLVFKVADSQDQYSLQLLSYRILCYYYEGDPLGETNIYEADLELDVKSNLREVTYPVYDRAIDPPNILEHIIEIPEQGILEFTGVERNVSQYGDTIFIHTKFTNTNQGDESSGMLRGYLIGDNGTMHDLSLYTHAGPGQVNEEVQQFEIPTNIKNLKLALYYWDDPYYGYFPELSVLQVVSIPEEIIKTRQ